MNHLKAKMLVIALIAVGALFAASAGADQWNKLTYVTFSAPIDLPGVGLPAGTYTFKLADTMANRNVVQVFSRDGKHIYGTFLTMADSRLEPAGKTIITFKEQVAGAPEAVRAWFYPGDTYGVEFVYPKSQALRIAKASNESVLSMAESTSDTSAMKNTPLMRISPSGEETEVSASEPAPQPTTGSTPAPEPKRMAAVSKRTRLPQTASEWPAMGLLGLIALASAAGIHLVSRRLV
jgi:LPXTG-motif cell wall-anchored protein